MVQPLWFDLDWKVQTLQDYKIIIVIILPLANPSDSDRANAQHGKEGSPIAIHWGIARIGTFALYSTLLLLV